MTLENFNWVKPEDKIMAGLTGTVASGKSTVSKMFAELGARVICADTLAKEELLPGRAGWKFLADTYGGVFFGPDGATDLKLLAQKVFADEKMRNGLESAVHPAVLANALSIARGAREGVVVFDAPLLFESGMKKSWFDCVISVSAHEDVRLERAVKRGWTREEFFRRSDAQLDGQEKDTLADFVIDNSGTPDALRARVEEVFTLIHLREK
ncbi:MAG: dephospho-CoA kinase [Elusimicrobiaceae bacterium]